MKKYLAIVVGLILVTAVWVTAHHPPQAPQSSPDASETVTGGVELATDAETVTGTATNKVTTPANITAKMSAPGAIGGTTPADATFNDVILSAAKHLLLPLHNDAVTPTFGFGDGDSGFYEGADDDISIAVSGARKYLIRAAYILGSDTNSFILSNETVSATNPTLSPRGSDQDTGVASAAADQLSLVAGGVEGIRVTEDTTIYVDIEGWLRMPEMGSDPAALADHAFLYAKDVGGTGNMFAADAAAGATQLTSHNFSMFTPDPNEQFPWSFYAENKALGVRINVDMARAIRAIETLTGEKFIHYEDIPKSVDLEEAYKEQWVKEYVEANTVMVEVSQVEATEMVEVDAPTGNKIGETVIGYEFVDGEVKPQTEAIPETHKVMMSQIKANCHFDTTDGKFYRTTRPTMEEANTVAVTGFKFSLPKWLADRLER